MGKVQSIDCNCNPQSLGVSPAVVRRSCEGRHEVHVCLLKRKNWERPEINEGG